MSYQNSHIHQVRQKVGDIRLLAASDNKDAIDFYKSHNFTPREVELATNL